MGDDYERQGLNPPPEKGTRQYSGYRTRFQATLDGSVGTVIKNNQDASLVAVQPKGKWSAIQQTMLENTIAVRMKDSWKEDMGMNATLARGGVNKATDFIPVITNHVGLPVPRNRMSLLSLTNSNAKERRRVLKDEILRSVIPTGIIQTTFWHGRTDGANTASTSGTQCDAVCIATVSLPIENELRPWEPVELDMSMSDDSDGRFSLKNISPDDIAECMRQSVVAYADMLAKENGVNFKNVFTKGGAGNIGKTSERPIFGQREEVGEKFLLGCVCMISKALRILKDGGVEYVGKGGSKEKLQANTVEEALKILSDVSRGESLAAAPFLKRLVDESTQSAPGISFEFSLEMNSIDMIAQAVAEETYSHKSIGVVITEVKKTPGSGDYRRFDYLSNVI